MRAGGREEEKHRGNLLQLDFKEEKSDTKSLITDRTSPTYRHEPI